MRQDRDLTASLAAIHDNKIVMEYLKTLSDHAAWASVLKGGDAFMAGKAVGLAIVIEEIRKAKEEFGRG